MTNSPYFICLFLLITVCCTKEKSAKINFEEKMSISAEFVEGVNLNLNSGAIAIIEPRIVTNGLDKSRLKYRWEIDNQIVSNKKNLSYIMPHNSKIGQYDGIFSILMDDYELLKQNFKVKITNPFGFGYYFLSSYDNCTVLSHVKSEEENGNVYNTTYIDDVKLGSDCKTLNAKYIVNMSGDNYYRINITTAQGKYPHLKFNKLDMRIYDRIGKSQLVDGFSPSVHVVDSRGDDFFITEGRYVKYDSNLHDSSISSEDYYWRNPIVSGIGKFAYIQDGISNKYYIIKPNLDNSIYDVVVDITNNQEMKGENIIYQFCEVKVKNIKEEVMILSTQKDKINFYKIVYDSGRAEFMKIKEYYIPDLSSETNATSDDEGNCYIAVGNKVYKASYPDYEMKMFLESDTEMGVITKLILSNNRKRLIISSYNQKATNIMKGAILIYGIEDRVLEVYPNSIAKCMSILDCS